jgi:hypothetical protein
MITGIFKKIIFLVLLLALDTASAKMDRWVTLNTINSRPAAMGGAFIAMEDPWSAIHWNPAGIGIPSDESCRISLRLNPAAPVIIIHDPQGVDNGMAPVALFVQGLSLANRRMSFGILPGEESISDIDRLKRSNPIDGRRYEWERNSDFAFNMKFSPRLSIGFALQAMIHHSDTGGIRWGYRYGILIKPKNNLNVGLCYFNMDNRYAYERMSVERIADETLNIGFAYQPLNPILFSADIRNVSDDGRGATRELHFGIEIQPIKNIFLRGGFFETREEKDSVWSGGIGFRKRALDPVNYIKSGIILGGDAAYLNRQHESGHISYCYFNIYLQF